MQHERVARDLHVDRTVTLAVLPVDTAAQVVDVEPLRRSQVEHPQDRHGRLQPRHAGILTLRGARRSPYPPPLRSDSTPWSCTVRVARCRCDDAGLTVRCGIRT